MRHSNRTADRDLPPIKFPLSRKEMQARMKFPEPGNPPPGDNVRVMNKDSIDDHLYIPLFITTNLYVKPTIMQSVFTLASDIFAWIMFKK